MRRLRRLAALLALVWLLPFAAQAHVGSKDVFAEAAAGPYQLFVTIRPPVVIPGVAQVELRLTGAPADSITVTPLALTGEGAKHAPTPDRMKRSAVDPNFYTGSVWMMVAGSMQVRFEVHGPAGSHVLSVPVPALALSTLKLQRTLGAGLALCGLILIVGLGGIAGATVREANLPAGSLPTVALRRRALLVSAATILFALLLVWGGNQWWKVEAANYADAIYRPLAVSLQLEHAHLRMLVSGHESARLGQSRSNADFILDHGQPMHLYVVRVPELDVVYHLHPAFTRAGEFDLDLPSMPPGRYQLYGDVVHANGFPETLVSTLDLAAPIEGVALSANDAAGRPAPLSSGELGPVSKLPSGYSMVWSKPASLTANTAYAFHFELLDPAGRPAAHMRPYLGMAGHAAFLKTDGTVFAHVHPEGSAAMAAVMLANNEGATLAAPGAEVSSMAAMPGMAMSGMQASPDQASSDIDFPSNAVEFPYGFPTSGRYRIFVQMKHDSTVETGTFDAVVK